MPGGGLPGFDPESYRERNVVERAVNKLRSTRAVANRYDKRDFIYRGTIDVAAIRIWLRDPVITHIRDRPWSRSTEGSDRRLETIQRRQDPRLCMVELLHGRANIDSCLAGVARACRRVGKGALQD